MRCLYLILFSAIVVSCKTKHEVLTDNKETFFSTECPKDGTCTFELMPNKSLKTQNDNLGALNMEIVNGKSLVFKFEYKRNEIPKTMDSQYIEQIFMALDPNNLEMKLKDSELKSVNLMFARFCYCKGQTGYYRVRQGELAIKKTEDTTYQLHLNFKVDEVPQIITEINQVFKLK